MSNIFRDSESLGKSNGKKWSNIWTFLFGSGLKSPSKKKSFFFADFALQNMVSRVTCHLFSFSFRTKWWSLSVEGLLSTGPTQSSFYLFIIIVKECYQTTSNQQTSQCKHLNAATKLKQFELGQMYRTTSMFNFFKTPKIWKDLKFAYLG